jgi:hypothetical protein
VWTRISRIKIVEESIPEIYVTLEPAKESMHIIPAKAHWRQLYDFAYGTECLPKRKGFRTSFPHAFSGNPDVFKSQDPRQYRAGVTVCVICSTSKYPRVHIDRLNLSPMREDGNPGFFHVFRTSAAVPDHAPGFVEVTVWVSFTGTSTAKTGCRREVLWSTMARDAGNGTC